MQNNPFAKVEVILDYVSGHKLQWWLQPTFNGKGPYTFNLIAYQDLGFKEVLFKKNVGENYFAIDDSHIRQNHLNSFIYKIELVTSDNKSYLSEMVGWQPSDTTTRNKYLTASEIVRKEWVRMKHTGLYGYLLKRKIYSPAAVGELDPVTNEPIIDTSNGSFGVGIKGGYFEPLLIKYTLENKSTSLDFSQEGKGSTYKELVKIRMVGFPYVDQHDILVSKEGKRYRISEQSEIFFPGTTIALIQNIVATIIPNTDTVYSINTPPFPNE